MSGFTVEEGLSYDAVFCRGGVIEFGGDAEMTEIQLRAFRKLTNKWQSAYTLKESLATLNALVRQDLAVKQTCIGAWWSPRVMTDYKIKRKA